MRSLWSGSLSFGLVNIPIKLFSASVDRALSFKLFDKHGNCPVSYVRVCRASGKEVSYEDIVKGYEYQKGDYIVLNEEDFKKAAPRKTDLIQILQFSDMSDIDPKYYEKPYYIEPDKKAAKAYVLLREALAKSKKVAIAKFLMREKEHIAAIRPEGDILVLHQLRYEDEIRKDPDAAIPKSTYSKEELDVALALIKKLGKKFDAGKFRDTYTEELMEVIKAKAKGKKAKVSIKSPYAKTTEMKDLMKLLKKSLEKEDK
jgi:DNA end-binding protein Ku